MIWALFALILLPVVLLLIKGGREEDAEANPVMHYRRQLDEVESDLKKGNLSKEAAAAATLEIERRILTLADAQEKRVTGGRSPIVAGVFTAAVLIVVTFALYSIVGRPSLPSKPGEVASQLDIIVPEEGITYGEAIGKVQRHLADNPDDKQGWNVLATSARSLGQYSLAANAFERLAELEPDNSYWRLQQLTSYVALGGGRLTPAANMLIEDILAAEPQHPAAHYYLGLGRMQAGDTDGAKAIWTALADRSPSDAPWMPTVRQQLARLGVAPPKLDQEQIQMVENMSEEERGEFVQAMLAGLEARLESNPNDADGWLMLARSKTAMGDVEGAREALTKAIPLVDEARRANLQAFLDNLPETPNP